MDLTTASDAELSAELNRREEARKAELRKEQLARSMTILANKTTLLALVKHGRTSCSDNNPVNCYANSQGYPRCVRCVLLELDEFNYTNYDFDFSLTVKQV